MLTRIHKLNLPALWPLIGLVALGVGLTLPAFIYGIPYGPDLSSHLRSALAFDQSLRQGNLIPGWLASSNGGYGDASFRVYPPAFHYLIVAMRALAGNWYAATLLTFALLTVAGGLSVYFWASRLCPRRYSVWAGVFYMLAAYHVNELYQASLLAEYAGGALVALMFGFAERVIERERATHIAGLAVSCALLTLTHPPLLMMSALGLLVYAPFRIGREKLRSVSIKLVLAFALGLAASACYWVTLVSELSWIKGDRVAPGTRFDYSQNFLFWNSSPAGVNNWWANALGLATLLLVWPAFIRRAEDQTGRPVALKLLVVFSFLMATPLSWPLWAVIPKLRSIEFPWRWLALTSVAGSVALASSLPFWLKKARQQEWRVPVIVAAGSLLIAATFTVMHPIRGAIYLARPEFDALLRELPGTESLPEWLPVWADGTPRKMSDRVEAGERKVSVTSWEDERRGFEIEAGDADEARVHVLFYPLWTASANGRPLPVRAASDGALLISLPRDAVSVHLEFREPARARITALISIAGWVLICALFVIARRRPLGRKFALANVGPETSAA
jgi:hypothetical protein